MKNKQETSCNTCKHMCTLGIQIFDMDWDLLPTNVSKRRGLKTASLTSVTSTSHVKFLSWPCHEPLASNHHANATSCSKPCIVCKKSSINSKVPISRLFLDLKHVSLQLKLLKQIRKNESGNAIWVPWLPWPKKLRWGGAFGGSTSTLNLFGVSDLGDDSRIGNKYWRKMGQM